MAIHATCPHCGTAQQFPEETLGQKQRCRQCQAEFLLEPRLQTTDPEPLAGQLANLEQRLARVESALGLTASPTAQPRPSPRIAPASVDRPKVDLPQPQPKPLQPRPTVRASRPLAPKTVARTPARKASIEDIPEVLPVAEEVGPSAKPSPPKEASPLPPPVPPPPPPPRAVRPAPTPPSGGNLEQTIGLKWAAWVGAIVLVIGAGLGIKFAYDQGWLNYLPASARLVLMSLAGFGLIAAGEWVYRRVNLISATGLFGAGVAVLFLVSYDGNLYYNVYSYETAFVFATATTLIASAVAIRGRLVSIAVLALIGGNLAPELVSTGQEEPGVPFFAYLFMLQAVGLTLAWWGNHPKWWVLRVFALATQTWWILILLARGPLGTPWAGEMFWFALLAAIAFQAELVLSAMRATPALDAEGSQAQAVDKGWGTVYSLFVTAGITALVLYLLKDQAVHRHLVQGAWVLGFAIACGVSGFLLWRRANPRLHALAIGYLFQAAALLILFVPVVFGDIWITIGWGALSLAYAGLGAWFDRRLARIAGLITWVLAIGSLLLSASTDPLGQGARAIWLTLLEHDIRAYTILGLLLAAAGHAVGWLTQTDLQNRERGPIAGWTQSALLFGVVASIVWVCAAVNGFPTLGATAVLVGGAWLLFGTDRWATGSGLLYHALALLAFAAVKWITIDTLADRLSPTWSADRYTPVFNPIMGVGLLVAMSLGSMLWLRHGTLEPELARGHLGGLRRGSVLFTAILLVIGLATFGLSFEVDRLVAQTHQPDMLWPAVQIKLFGMTMLWTAAAVALAFVCRRLGYPHSLPWVVLVALAAKFLAVDTLGWYLAAPSVLTPVLLNLQFATALVLLSGFAATYHLTRPSSGQAFNTTPFLPLAPCWSSSGQACWKSTGAWNICAWEARC